MTGEEVKNLVDTSSTFFIAVLLLKIVTNDMRHINKTLIEILATLKKKSK